MVKLYVEGGGDTAALRTACREGFSQFITKAGITRRPRIVACGNRRDAFESYCTAIANGEEAVLLVDSEAPVETRCQQGGTDQWTPWVHLKNRQADGWDKPVGESDADCHLMVQCMESWFLADRAALKEFFGQGFKENQLPPVAGSVEHISKAQVYQSLANATQDCKTRARYGKGEHSFKLLATISPACVIAASLWAKRFVESLKERMNA